MAPHALAAAAELLAAPWTRQSPDNAKELRTHPRRSSVTLPLGGGRECAVPLPSVRTLRNAALAALALLLILLHALYVTARDRPPLPVVGLPPADEQARRRALCERRAPRSRAASRA